MTDNERLKKLIFWLISQEIIESQEDLAIKLGYNASSVSQIVTGKKKISDKFVKNICGLSNKINPDYLLADGQMLIEDESVLVENVTGRAYQVPLLPVSAIGGSLNDFVLSVKQSECERIVSPIIGADFAIPVTGDSMSPEYPNGSQLLIKKINERAFIDWGKVYVLDTCNGVIVKEVHQIEDDATSVLCVSLNKDSKYKPFKVKCSDIYGMYRVMMCMSLK